MTRQALKAAINREEVLRLPRGVLIDAERWQNAASWDRHLLRARGLMHGPLGAPESTVALSHHSALALHGIPFFGVDDRVHLVRTDGRRSSSDALVCSHAAISSRWVQSVDGIRVVAPMRAAFQVAALCGVESGVVSVDACLRAGATDDELIDAATAGGYGRGALTVRVVKDFADGRSESAGESRARWVFSLLGLPEPVPQAEIRNADGEFVGRVDFLFKDQHTVVEFDGLAKYAERSDLIREKAREDALRALGYSVVRITWADLAKPVLVHAKVMQGFALAAA
ncbi:endonuclease domain-containing protein [Ornithinimicrobium sp. F0845]|uniref:endonuclease domain-containing protein n=1 Tax=Ornithinimicrobium sp. F0845 TaxID=2926412 RepID=UPI001FF308FC|nr:endonuclease domain-containing protein [Ornithinimicrobium sp. F0845]